MDAAADGAGTAFFVTTPIYYVNDAPHIGHAYTTVAADVLARWHRARGERVHFLTGTDEHGQKILRAAQAHGTSPQAWVDRLVDSDWLPMLAAIDASHDDFIRTTEDRHVRGVGAFWSKLHAAGDVYAGEYTGLYCVACEDFKTPGELLEGTLCAVHRRPVEPVAERNWFFRLSAYAEPLLAHYAANPDFVGPESARNEVVSFVAGGLADISMSRSSFDWGIPVPWDPTQVIYVWLDALLNYVTAAGWAEDPERFALLWPADVHLVGKDILRFHAVIWPAMLMAAGLPLPRRVFANGWLLVGGEKMGKTNATGVAPAVVIEHVGSDALRYYFLREIAFGADGSFSWESLTARYTSELADDFGNLASRVTSMVERYRGGVLPGPGDLGPPETELAGVLERAAGAADAAIDRLDFQGALAEAMSFVRAANVYVTVQAPWVLARDPALAGRLDAVLATAADALRAAAVLLSPVLPRACASLWEQLGADTALGSLTDQRMGAVAPLGQLPAGVRVRKGDLLFPRLDQESAPDFGASPVAPGGAG